MKIENNIPFQTVGTSWSMWVPDGIALTIEISPDGKTDHFVVCADNVTGPDMFQCNGYNPNTYFRVSGFDGTLDILL